MKLRVLLLLAFAVAVSACNDAVTQRQVIPREPDALDVAARIEMIEQDELTYNFPNSMCQVMSEDGCEMRLELARSRILLQTQALARQLSAAQRDDLLIELRGTSAEEDCRMLVIARVLAAAGAGADEIESAIPPQALCRAKLPRVVREGRGIRELG